MGRILMSCAEIVSNAWPFRKRWHQRHELQTFSSTRDETSVLNEEIQNERLDQNAAFYWNGRTCISAQTSSSSWVEQVACVRGIIRQCPSTSD